MLMVTTTMRMLNRVHGNTSDFRPAVALDLVLVVRTSSLQHGLVNTSTSSNDANHGAVGRRHDLLGAGGQLDAGPLGVGVVGDDSAEVAAGPGKLAAVTSLLLNAAHDGSLRHHTHGQDVANLQNGLLASVHKLSSVHPLAGDKGLSLGLVLVGVTEGYLSQGSTTAGVVDDVLDDTLDVAMTLSKVNSSQGWLAFPCAVVGLEYRPSTLSLCANYTAHLGLGPEERKRKLH